MTHVYKYTYILLICFLNTGRTISEGPDGVSHFASLQLLKMFCLFFFSSLSFLFWFPFFLGRDGECMGGAAPYHSLIFFNLTS